MSNHKDHRITRQLAEEVGFEVVGTEAGHKHFRLILRAPNGQRRWFPVTSNIDSEPRGLSNTRSQLRQLMRQVMGAQEMA